MPKRKLLKAVKLELEGDDTAINKGRLQI